MNDIFNEQLVKKNPNQKDLLKKIGIAAAAILVFAAALLFIPSMALVVGLVLIFGIVFLFRRLDLEFEYVLTNNELDINKIMNKSSRKKILSVNVKSFLAMVPAANNNYAHEVAQFEKAVDYSSGKTNENTYIALFIDKDNKKVKMTFEPNEKMLKSMKMYIPNIIRK